MDILVLKSYYQKRGESRKTTELALDQFKKHLHFLEHKDCNVEAASLEIVKDYIDKLIADNENSFHNLITLARIYYLAKRNEIYIYFTQILERENIIENIHKHIEEVIGKKSSKTIYSALNKPEIGSPPEKAIYYTKTLVEQLENKLDKNICRKALTGNAHAIPKEAFAKEREYFLKSTSLESYLREAHKRAVKTLQHHADSGEVWYEQSITQNVVDYVAKSPEVLGGVLRDAKIFWTKIPYVPNKWLLEEDIEKKRYLACHCPMAREALNKDKIIIPRSWCYCTSGYVKQRFNAIFDCDIEVELLETVLAGDNRCRFAILVPEKFL